MVEQKHWPKNIFILFIIVPSFLLGGCETQTPIDAQANLESIAQEINKTLMCPICPSETIDQSQVTLAKQMRVMVREQLSDGQNREQILEYFVDRYGPGILAAPPKKGFNLLAWVVPPIILVIGTFIVTLTVAGMKKNTSSGNDNADPLPNPDLVDYFPTVDQRIRQIVAGDIIPGNKVNTEEKPNTNG